MIQKITTEELKLLKMFYNQRDSQLIMIQEIITNTSKVPRSNKDKLKIFQLRVKEEIALKAEF
jgi:hypothetical protein